MYADIEALVLSGELFNGRSRPSSPARSPSPDAGWHDDELNEEEQKYRDQGVDYDSDTARRDAIRSQKQTEAQPESIGMGPGRTGVKGVIRDRNEVANIRREKRAQEMEDLRRKMEAGNLGGKTYLEEEREKAARGETADSLVENGFLEGRQDVFGRNRQGRFGHLREVGLNGFVGAVEEEERGVWVVIHLYDPSLERCYLLDEILARLARSFSETKFLRARASTLGFASTSTSSSKVAATRRLKPPLEINEDDPYADDDGDQDDDSDEEIVDDDNVDLDMLPTMLVYRDGELVHNWVRVDWEAGRGGVEELLNKNHILSRNSAGGRDNLGLPLSDDEDDYDLMWSDDDDIKHA